MPGYAEKLRALATKLEANESLIAGWDSEELDEIELDIDELEEKITGAIEGAEAGPDDEDEE